MNQRLVATIQLLTVVVAGAFVAVLAKLALSQLPGRLAANRHRRNVADRVHVFDPR